MNKIIIIGRLTKDPEIRLTQSGKKVASFAIAVDDGKDTNGNRLSQYFNCSAWDSLADLLDSYVKKGHRIAIVGKLQNRSWDKPDGSKAYATDIQVREIEMLTSKSEAEQIASQEGNSGSNSGQSSQSASNSSSNNSKPEQDLPEIDVDSIDKIDIQMPF